MLQHQIHRVLLIARAQSTQRHRIQVPLPLRLSIPLHRLINSHPLGASQTLQLLCRFLILHPTLQCRVRLISSVQILLSIPATVLAQTLTLLVLHLFNSSRGILTWLKHLPIRFLRLLPRLLCQPPPVASQPLNPPHSLRKRFNPHLQRLLCLRRRCRALTIKLLRIRLLRKLSPLPLIPLQALLTNQARH